MTRAMNKKIRADAADHATLMSDKDLMTAILQRKERIQELEEELKYHAAHLAGYSAIASERGRKRE